MALLSTKFLLESRARIDKIMRFVRYTKNCPFLEPNQDGVIYQSLLLMKVKCTRNSLVTAFQISLSI